MMMVPNTDADQDRLAWWRDAKFGMFIHWGLYSVPAGNYKGLEAPYISEWIMNWATIPISEYEQYAKQFNPTKFDADQWVLLAKEAGMKYIVITSKHHDGFAMYDSKVSDYDIADASPYPHDPIKLLAEACQKHGLKLGLYYSNDQDWHEPNASGNDWDFETPENERDFQQFLDDKVKPQVRELLTHYGPIAIIWFDTPKLINESQSRELVDLVHELQPDCLVNGRVGNDQGDYVCFGDNQVPGGVTEGGWETCATINDSWGYKAFDNNWKSAETMLCLLTDIVSKGGTYLLNVGPTAEGIIPEPSAERLRAMGDWLSTNGEAIYGAGPSPYPGPFEWGTITTKPDKLYVHVYDRSLDEVVLFGLKNKVEKAYLLADKGRNLLRVEQMQDNARDCPILRIDLIGQHRDEPISVIVLEIEGRPQVDSKIVQQADGRVYLEAYRADIQSQSDQKPKVEGGGIVTNWNTTDAKLNWDFTIAEPGRYDCIILTAAHHWSGFNGGHQVQVAIDDQKIETTIDDQGRLDNRSTLTQQDAVTAAGSIQFEKPGNYHAELCATKMVGSKWLGFQFRTMLLVPIEQRFMEATAFVEPHEPIKKEIEEFRQKLEALK